MTTGPAVTVATPDDAGAEQGLDPMVFTVTRSSTATPTMVALAWGRHGDARLRHTVTAAGGTLSAERLWLTFNTGQTTVTVTVIPVDDLFVESAETVTLTVVAGIGYTVGAIVFGTGSIADNDVVAVPEVSVSATSSAGNEQGQIPIVFTVTRTGVTTGTTNVTLAWSGSATLTTDYAVAVSGTGVRQRLPARRPGALARGGASQCADPSHRGGRVDPLADHGWPAARHGWLRRIGS